MEADYVKKTVGNYLVAGLAEVSVRRPADPIEYLALWLLKEKQEIRNQEVHVCGYIFSFSSIEL